MPDRSQLIQALNTGDAEMLSTWSASDIDQSVLTDESVQTALMCAAEQVVFHRPNYRKAIEQVVELGAACDIWTAARAGLVDYVKRLLAEQPALLEALDGRGRTPLQRAALVYGACRECEEVADFLIAEGAAVDVFTAATFCLPDIVHRELQRTPDVVSARCQGSTPLNWAVRPRRNAADAPQVCKALLDAGAKIDDRDEDESGMTPLHHAAEWGAPICLKLADLLLEAGADVNCIDDQGWTPLDYAKDRGRKEMVAHLTAHGGLGKA